jgi:hypothetical protein
MVCDLFIPYVQGPSLDIKDNMNGYYKTEQDYADALIREDSSNGMVVYETMSRGGFDSRTLYGGFGNERRKIDEKIAYAKAECIPLTPDGMYDEDVDSLIDKFVSQNEFLISFHFDMMKMDAEFEEEIKGWAKETLNIYKVGNDMVKNGSSSYDRDEFIERNIPRRDLRISFLNKSGKRVNFSLMSCEVERKVARNRYLIYVKKMEILK